MNVKSVTRVLRRMLQLLSSLFKYLIPFGGVILPFYNIVSLYLRVRLYNGMNGSGIQVQRLDELEKRRVNLVTVAAVGALTAAVQAQLLAWTYTNTSNAGYILLNAINICAMLLDVMGAWAGLSRSASFVPDFDQIKKQCDERDQCMAELLEATRRLDEFDRRSRPEDDDKKDAGPINESHQLERASLLQTQDRRTKRWTEQSHQASRLMVSYLRATAQSFLVLAILEIGIILFFASVCLFAVLNFHGHFAVYVPGLVLVGVWLRTSHVLLGDESERSPIQESLMALLDRVDSWDEGRRQRKEVPIPI